jgi:hypothetical protein
MVSRSLKLNVIIIILGRGMELRDIVGALTLDYKTVKNGFKGYKLYNIIFKDLIKIF